MSLKSFFQRYYIYPFNFPFIFEIKLLMFYHNM